MFRDQPRTAGRRALAARDGLVALHLPLVEHCARRFRNRGEPFEDLVQVGTIGLIKSIDRFDLDRGVEFSTYATPTIIGEIKRYFRDKGWAIRVPRRLQELRMQIGSHDRRAHPDAGPLPHAARARRGDRLHGGGDRRGHRVQQRLLDALASTPATTRRGGRRRRCSTMIGLDDDGARARRDPRVDQAAARGARRRARSGSCCCGSSGTRPSRRSPRRSGSARCTSRGCSAAPSTSCATLAAGERADAVEPPRAGRASVERVDARRVQQPDQDHDARRRRARSRPRSCRRRGSSRPARGTSPGPRTIGLARPGAAAQHQPARTAISASAEQQRRRAAVVTPIAARSASMWAASSDAVRRASSRPSTATRPAATTSGGGRRVPGRRARDSVRPAGVRTGGAAGRTSARSVTACDKT